jgi:hypothetical protein
MPSPQAIVASQCARAFLNLPEIICGCSTRLTALTATAAGGALSGQALFLSLGAEEAPVFEFPKNPGVLYRGAKTVNQTLRAFSVPRCYKSHSVLLYICGLDLPPRPLPSLLKSPPTSLCPSVQVGSGWRRLARVGPQALRIMYHTGNQPIKPIEYPNRSHRQAAQDVQSGLTIVLPSISTQPIG